MPLFLGVHAEMVTQLTKLGGLKVASRTSALEYRDSRKKRSRDRVGAGRRATLLRGTIQRSGDQVRFSVALADAPNGSELWAESYDRPYTAENLFEVQGDIARQVAAALRVQLTAQQQQQMTQAPTTNVAALDAYYRGLLAWHNRGILSEDEQTITQLERAVELDTSFVAAWSLLAQARSWMIRRGLESDTLWAWAAVQHAQRLAPGSLEASVAAGYYRYYARGDFAGGARRPLGRRPADAQLERDPLRDRAARATSGPLGRCSRRISSSAAALDPRNGQLATNVAETFTLMRRFPQAQPAIERALMLAPGSSATHVQKFVMYTAMGDTSGARAALRDASGAVPERTRQVMSAELAMLARDYRAALSGFAHRVPEFSSTFSAPEPEPRARRGGIR